MDKIARAIRDTYNIHYTSALDLKRKIMADPGFTKKLEEANAVGKKMKDLIVELAKTEVARDFEPEQ